jgi:hypothetical protein
LCYACYWDTAGAQETTVSRRGCTMDPPPWHTRRTPGSGAATCAQQVISRNAATSSPSEPQASSARSSTPDNAGRARCLQPTPRIHSRAKPIPVPPSPTHSAGLNPQASRDHALSRVQSRKPVGLAHPGRSISVVQPVAPAAATTLTTASLDAASGRRARVQTKTNDPGCGELRVCEGGSSQRNLHGSGRMKARWTRCEHLAGMPPQPSAPPAFTAGLLCVWQARGRRHGAHLTGAVLSDWQQLSTAPHHLLRRQ